MGVVVPINQETIQKLRIQIAMGMKKRALSQHDFARLLGTHRSQVSRMLRSKRWNPRIAWIQRMADVLHTDIEIHIKPNGGK